LARVASATVGIGVDVVVLIHSRYIRHRVCCLIASAFRG